MPPDKVRHYVQQGLQATPLVLQRLLRDASPADLDRRPDPDRFTIREVIAHLADFEPIFVARIEAIRGQDNPTLEAYDEGQLAIEHDYANADVTNRLAHFLRARSRLLGLVRTLAPAEWDRIGRHPELGPLSLADQVVLILGHDGYHLRQVAEWLEAGR